MKERITPAALPHSAAIGGTILASSLALLNVVKPEEHPAPALPQESSECESPLAHGPGCAVLNALTSGSSL